MRVCLAYSGGLDTTVSIPWIKEKYGAEVVTVTVDVGQEEDFEEIRERALSAGAYKHYHIDAKLEFAERFIKPSIKANALYQDAYPLSAALSRPLIAMKVVEVARKEGCDAVAHGCTGKGNDQIRFDVTFSALAPDLKVIAPVREWNMSRDAEIEYAKSKGLKLDFKKSRFSIDENLWGRSIEAAELEDPSTKPPTEAFKFVREPEKAPDVVETVEIEFESGVPIALNGEDMKLVELVRRLNEIGGRNGFGVIDHIEDRVVGFKSREVYEAPAALMLIRAHMELERMTLNSKTLRFKKAIDEQWAYMVYAGYWLDPLMDALSAFIEETQRYVTGRVKLELYKGSLRIAGRVAESPLYSHEIATYSSESVFDQAAGTGFSKIWGLETVISRNRCVKTR